jgi:hypothetical protein
MWRCHWRRPWRSDDFRYQSLTPTGPGTGRGTDCGPSRSRKIRWLMECTDQYGLEYGLATDGQLDDYASFLPKLARRCQLHQGQYWRLLNSPGLWVPASGESDILLRTGFIVEGHRKCPANPLRSDFFSLAHREALASPWPRNTCNATGWLSQPGAAEASRSSISLDRRRTVVRRRPAAPKSPSPSEAAATSRREIRF